jgi:epoxide hydrolase 4
MNAFETASSAQQLIHRTVKVGEVALHYVDIGAGPIVLLLHGFPDFWYSWRHQLVALAAARYRAVAPDMRGYNESSRPRAVRDYRVRFLIDDVVHLIQRLDQQPAVIVGHDWGGVIAWRLAALELHVVQRLVVLNAPHPAAFRRALMRSPTQILRSSYAMFFQLPWLPEALLQAGDFAVLEQIWRSTSRRNAFSEYDICAYKTALRRPTGLTGPLNYYRAAVRWPGDLYSGPHKPRRLSCYGA